MDYKKEYKGALARCKWLLSIGMISETVATDMFRELIDNNSENVRKEIINIFHSLVEGKIPVQINFADIFEWLEKRGEQKLANKGEPKFKVGDKIVEDNEFGMVGGEITDIDDAHYELDGGNRYIPISHQDNYKLVEEQKYAWNEEDKGNLLDVKCIIDEVWHNQDVREKIDYSCKELESLWNWLDNIWQRVEYPSDHLEAK
jgi:hypothetical protein